MTLFRNPWLGALAVCSLLAVGSAAQDDKQDNLDKETKALIEQASKLLKGNAAEKKQLIPLIHRHLEAKGNKVNEVDAQIAFEIASFLENQDHRELAAAAYAQFATDLAATSSKKVSGLARVMQGAGRRLGALGKELDIKGKALDGTDVDLSKLRGKVVLVDFWATWCGPCLREIPNIKKMYAKYHAKGFDVIGISVDDNKGKLEEFLKDEKLPWPCIYDHGTPEGARLSEAYGVLSIPQAILIDQDGKVVALEARGEELERLLTQLIDKAGGAGNR
jgi:thiol-disulfide isomerase/thioredoxin